MSVITVYPRVRPVRALRVLLYVTPKSEILAFCPRANVGVKTRIVDGTWVDDEKDVHWVMVPHNGDLWDSVKNDGDWIVEKSPGHFFILTDTEFHNDYLLGKAS